MSHQPTDLWREVKRVCERHALKPDREFVYDHMSRELDDAIDAAHAAATARIAAWEEARVGIVTLISAASAASGYLERQRPDLSQRLWTAVTRVSEAMPDPAVASDSALSSTAGGQ